MNVDSPLGVLSRLPLELRLDIWEWLDPGEENFFAVSRAIRRETTSVRQNFHLTFSISPLPSLGRFPSAIKVHDKFKDWPTLYPAFLDFDSPERSSLERLLRFPFNTLSSIQLDIDLPDPEDPGQIIRVFNSLMWLVDLFGRAPGSCKITNARFSAKHLPYWLTGPGIMPPTIAYCQDGNQNPIADLMKILLPLKRLRGTSLQIEFPVAINGYGIFTQRVNWMMKKYSAKPFGAGRYRDVRLGPDDTQAQYESTIAAHFDLMLDDLPGTCASCLRLERFAFWGVGYVSNHLHRHWGHFGVAFESWLGNTSWARTGTEFNRRSRAMHAFNPLGWRILSGHPNYDAVDHLDDEADEEYRDCNKWSHHVVPDSRDGWSLAAWFETYKEQGIPRSSSEEYRTRVFLYGPHHHDCKEPCQNLYRPWHFERRDSILCRPASGEPEEDFYSIGPILDQWEASDDAHDAEDSEEFDEADQDDGDDSDGYF